MQISQANFDTLGKVRILKDKFGHFHRLIHNGSDTRIAKEIRDNIYINQRQPARGTFIDKSTRRAGKQKLTNRLQCLKKVDFDWIGEISDDQLRKNLKRLFITF